MDRRQYILRRLKKELCALGYEEENLCRFGDEGIGAVFMMNEGTEECYSVQLRWFFDDTIYERIFFQARRENEQVIEENETEILRFCNDWNKQGLPCSAAYDKEYAGLHVYYTLPLAERISDIFLMLQLYLMPARCAEDFFKETQQKFKWQLRNKKGK